MNKNRDVCGWLWWKFEKNQDRTLSKNNNPGLVFFIKNKIQDPCVHEFFFKLDNMKYAFWTAHFCVHTCPQATLVLYEIYREDGGNGITFVHMLLLKIQCCFNARVAWKRRSLI